MSDFKIFAGSGIQTLPAFAYSAAQLSLARWRAEVCCGSANVVDIALKVRVFGKLLGFAQY